MNAKAIMALGVFVFLCAVVGNWLFPDMGVLASALFGGLTAGIGAVLAIKFFGRKEE